MTRSFKDQCGNEICLNHSPQRIISLVPSQTEMLHELGLNHEIVGLTKYCVHPTHWMAEKTIIGGTKIFDFKVINKLSPDLIIGNKEENYKEGIELLQKKYPVWVSDINSLPDAIAMIKSIGDITEKTDQAENLVSQIEYSFARLNQKKYKRTLYLIWRKPWMAAGANTFIDKMLESIGLENCISHLNRYPELSVTDIHTLNPEIILLSSEPFPFREKHIAELKKINPQSQVMLVDGEMFSWYGSRLKESPAYFNSLEFQ